MAKLFEITGKALSGEWGKDDENGNGIPILRTTNFTNEGLIDFSNVVTRIITKEKIEENICGQEILSLKSLVGVINGLSGEWFILRDLKRHICLTTLQDC